MWKGGRGGLVEGGEFGEEGERLVWFRVVNLKAIVEGEEDGEIAGGVVYRGEWCWMSVRI